MKNNLYSRCKINLIMETAKPVRKFKPKDVRLGSTLISIMITIKIMIILLIYLLFNINLVISLRLQ